ncbi:MAG: cell division protein FtsQ/DivIB [Pseudomonadota bacterium]
MRSLMLDPTSKWSYRFQRIWLTPILRALLRTGIPCFVVSLLVLNHVSQPETRQALAASLLDARAWVEERPEFMVRLMSVEGAPPEVADAIRGALHLDLPLSRFDLDLEALRQSVEDQPPVKRAALRIRPGGLLEVSVIERVPALVWRSAQGLVLLDIDGVAVATAAARADRADLPLVVGQGADAAASEALDLFQAASPLAARARGLRRMGARRWDVVLDRGQVIQLPEAGAVRALERVILLDQSQELLARAITHIDLRNPRRPTLRMAEDSLEELREIKGLEFGGGSQ